MFSNEKKNQNLGLDFCTLNEHSASFIDRPSLGAAARGPGADPLRAVPSSPACQELPTTADVRGSHAVAAEAVPVFLNVLELQDFTVREMQGRRFHFDVI